MRNKLIEKIVYKDEIITVGKVEIRYNEYSDFLASYYYNFSFLGDMIKVHSSDDDIKKLIEKRKKAYDLVPSGAKIITPNLVRLCEGFLIGGILEDSIQKVYGIAGANGLDGYSCSVYWLLTDNEINSFINYKALKGDFLIK